MNMFIIVLPGPDIEGLVERVKSAGFVSDVHVLTDSTMLVRSYADSPQMLTDHIGMSGDMPQTTGVVFKLNGSYFGYYRKALWQWLEASRV